MGSEARGVEGTPPCTTRNQLRPMRICFGSLTADCSPCGEYSAKEAGTKGLKSGKTPSFFPDFSDLSLPRQATRLGAVYLDWGVRMYVFEVSA